jgi:hypothetical protein
MNDASMYMIKAVLILDNDGERLISKYFDNELFPTAKEQRAFESKLFDKTSKDQDSEIVLLDDLTIIYRSNVDLFFYIVGDASENELILSNLLAAFYDSVSNVLSKNVEKRCLLANLHSILLIVDELVDDGIIMDIDCNSIMQKIGCGPSASAFGALGGEGTIGEQTVAQVFQQAKEFKWGSILK